MLKKLGLEARPESSELMLSASAHLPFSTFKKRKESECGIDTCMCSRASPEEGVVPRAGLPGGFELSDMSAGS